MENKAKRIYLIILCLVIILIAGYFAASKFGFLSKSNMGYVKENSIQNLKQQIDQKENIEDPKEESNSLSDEQIKKGDNSDIKKDISSATPNLGGSKKVAPSNDQEKTDTSNVGKIVDKLMSSGFEKSTGRKIDTIIVHTSYNAIGSDLYNVDDVIKQYRQYGVSAHYLIGRNGTIYRLVKENNIAWHAGVSKMPDGRTNTNDFSVGIEVINTQEGKFSDEEYKALNKLIADIKSRYNIKYILGHNDIAPGRKTDPWGIEWDKVNK